MKKGDRVKTINTVVNTDGLKGYEGIITNILKSGLIVFKGTDGYRHYYRPENLILVNE